MRDKSPKTLRELISRALHCVLNDADGQYLVGDYSPGEFDELHKLLEEAIKKTPCDLYLRRCQLHRAVDGDTVDLLVDLGLRTLTRNRFRLNGIDTPERGQPGYNEATERLQELIDEGSDLEGWFWVQTYRHGKFRWLADLYTLDGIHINQQLVEEGHAVAYDGGKK